MITRILVLLSALTLGLPLALPLPAGAASPCTQSTIKQGTTFVANEIVCTGDPSVAAPYLAKMTFRPLLPKLQPATPPTITIDEGTKNADTLTLLYSGSALVTTGRPVTDVRITEAKANLPGKGSTYQRWLKVVDSYRKNAKALGAQIIKLKNGHPAVWFAKGQPTLMVAKGVSITLSGSSGQVGITTAPHLSVADTLAIANSLRVFHGHA